MRRRRRKEDRQTLSQLYAELHRRVPKNPTETNLRTTFSDKELRILMRENGLMINTYSPAQGRYIEMTKNEKVAVLMRIITRLTHPEVVFTRAGLTAGPGNAARNGIIPSWPPAMGPQPVGLAPSQIPSPFTLQNSAAPQSYQAGDLMRSTAATTTGRQKAPVYLGSKRLRADAFASDPGPGPKSHRPLVVPQSILQQHQTPTNWTTMKTLQPLVQSECATNQDDIRGARESASLGAARGILLLSDDIAQTSTSAVANAQMLYLGQTQDAPRLKVENTVRKPSRMSLSNLI
eukprot:SAG31_NODE_1336_length_8738_cov_4.855655_3_plen_291_part_00